MHRLRRKIGSSIRIIHITFVQSAVLVTAFTVGPRNLSEDAD